MKLHYNVASPFVRKVMAVAIETGLDGRLEPVNRTMTPVKPDADLVRDNPLGKIPCLVDRRRRRALRLAGDLRVPGQPARRAEDVSGAGPARWTRAAPPGRGRRHHGCRGARPLRDLPAPAGAPLAGVARGPEGRSSAAPSMRSRPRPATFGSTVDIGTITIGCALGYLDFRYGDEDWRATRPKLAAWFERFAKRPSMARTAPAEIR